MEQKELVINGKVYAKYQYDAEKKILFIKVIEKLVPNSLGESEEMSIYIISQVEKVEVFGAGYLNV